MSIDLQPEVHIIITQVPGVDGISSPAQLAQIEADLSDVKGRADITSLDAVPGVNVPDPGDGQVLSFDEGSGGDGEWVSVDIPTGVAVFDAANNAITWDASALFFRLGLDATLDPGDPTKVRVQPTYGSVGSTVANGAHTHTQPIPARVSTEPSGYMSGGSRPAGSTNVTLANGITYIVEAELYGQLRGADSGAAYYMLTLNIGGDARTSPGGENGFWCVQGVPDKIYWEHHRRMTGTGASVPVSATISYHSGSGFNVDRMYLKVRLRPER